MALWVAMNVGSQTMAAPNGSRLTDRCLAPDNGARRDGARFTDQSPPSWFLTFLFGGRSQGFICASRRAAGDHATPSHYTASPVRGCVESRTMNAGAPSTRTLPDSPCTKCQVRNRTWLSSFHGYPAEMTVRFRSASGHRLVCAVAVGRRERGGAPLSLADDCPVPEIVWVFAVTVAAAAGRVGVAPSRRGGVSASRQAQSLRVWAPKGDPTHLAARRGAFLVGFNLARPRTPKALPVAPRSVTISSILETRERRFTAVRTGIRG